MELLIIDLTWGFFAVRRLGLALMVVACTGLVAGSDAVADELKLAGRCMVLDYDTNFPAGKPVQTRYVWSGDCAGGLAEGPGELQAYWDDQLDESTRGNMHRGRLEGHALTWSPNGARFVGSYRGGRRNGPGVYTGFTRAGLRICYVGGFADGLAQGHGVETLSSGERYDGDFSAGKRSGHGLQSGLSAQGLRYQYQGDFADDVWSGHGILSWSNGDRYEGEFRSGNRNGPGVLTRGNGDRLEGEFVDGQLQTQPRFLVLQYGSGTGGH